MNLQLGPGVEGEVGRRGVVGVVVPDPDATGAVLAIEADELGASRIEQPEDRHVATACAFRLDLEVAGRHEICLSAGERLARVGEGPGGRRRRETGCVRSRLDDRALDGGGTGGPGLHGGPGREVARLEVVAEQHRARLRTTQLREETGEHRDDENARASARRSFPWSGGDHALPPPWAVSPQTLFALPRPTYRSHDPSMPTCARRVARRHVVGLTAWWWRAGVRSARARRHPPAAQVARRSWGSAPAASAAPAREPSSRAAGVARREARWCRARCAPRRRTPARARARAPASGAP